MKISESLRILEKKIEEIEKKIEENESMELSNLINHSKKKFKKYTKKDKLSKTRGAIISFFNDLEKIWSDESSESTDEKKEKKPRSKKIKIEKK